MHSQKIWDIFCTVIDNHGDIGVCWRLARQLRDADQRVRLWVDDASALDWMAPNAAQEPGIELRPWAQASDAQLLNALPAAQVWIEAFGCHLPELFVEHAVATRPEPPLWINLEYLSAQAWVPRMHGLPSPVLNGPARGWSKRFFYPGFTADTGGLLRESDLLERQQAFDRIGWRRQHAPDLSAEGRLISLFCYEPVTLPDLLGQLSSSRHHLLVTPGRALAAVQSAVRNLSPAPAWSALPYTDQNGFDRMLWACDLNFVRGEDSLVRALWAGQPFIWQIYPQHDHAHHDKLHAFLDWLRAPASLRAFHLVWNAMSHAPLPTLNDETLREWAQTTQAARARLLTQADLVQQLLDESLSKPGSSVPQSR